MRASVQFQISGTFKFNSNLFSPQELVSAKEEDKNWRGILISIVCICLILIRWNNNPTLWMFMNNIGIYETRARGLRALDKLEPNEQTDIHIHHQPFLNYKHLNITRAQDWSQHKLKNTFERLETHFLDSLLIKGPLWIFLPQCRRGCVYHDASRTWASLWWEKVRNIYWQAIDSESPIPNPGGSDCN